MLIDSLYWDLWSPVSHWNIEALGNYLHKPINIQHFCCSFAHFILEKVFFCICMLLLWGTIHKPRWNFKFPSIVPQQGPRRWERERKYHTCQFWKVRESFQRQESLWQQQIRNYYVTHLELLAVLQALFHFKCFLLHTDNICFWEYREQTQSLFDVI